MNHLEANEAWWVTVRTMATKALTIVAVAIEVLTGVTGLLEVVIDTAGTTGTGILGAIAFAGAVWAYVKDWSLFTKAREALD